MKLYRIKKSDIDKKGKGKISQRDLTRAMGNRRGSIAMIFGHQNTTHAMNIFSKLDEEDTGAVDYATFAKNCEEAFLVDDEGDENDFVPFPAAAPIGVKALAGWCNSRVRAADSNRAPVRPPITVPGHAASMQRPCRAFALRTLAASRA